LQVTSAKPVYNLQVMDKWEASWITTQVHSNTNTSSSNDRCQGCGPGSSSEVGGTAAQEDPRARLLADTAMNFCEPLSSSKGESRVDPEGGSGAAECAGKRVQYQSLYSTDEWGKGLAHAQLLEARHALAAVRAEAKETFSGAAAARADYKYVFFPFADTVC